MTTNDGTEIMTMTSVEMTLSVTVFFFKAAQMPKMKPSGTETIKATMLILMDGAKRSKMMFIAEAEGRYAEESPQFHSVKIPLSQAPYWRTIGFS